jgi:hypothetical protein
MLLHLPFVKQRTSGVYIELHKPDSESVTPASGWLAYTVESIGPGRAALRVGPRQTLKKRIIPMRVIRVLSLSFALAAASLVVHAQTFDKVIVHLPYTVMAGSRQLAPGDYEIVPVHGSGSLFEIYNDSNSHEVVLLSAIRASQSDPAKTTELVLNNNGNGEYTLDQMWIQGDITGYEFLAPKSAAPHGKQLSAVEVRAEATR